MNPWDLILVLVVGLCLLLALRSVIIRKKKGGCCGCGNGSSCSACANYGNCGGHCSKCKE